MQPGVVYGPGDPGPIGALLARHMLGRVPAAPTRTAFSWGHVADVADAHVLAMEHGRPGRAYIVAGEHRQLREVMSMVGRLVGKRRGPFPVPGLLFRPLAGVAAAGGIFSPWLRSLADRIRATAGATYLGDDTRARTELGFAPRSLEEGLPDAVRSLLQQLFQAV
jgi:nucleoside-diphosphate-sugar epimerase